MTWSRREPSCANCERCTWNPGPDCGKAEHDHCAACGHCCGRHVRRGSEDTKRLAAELDDIAWELRTFDRAFTPLWLGVLAALLLTLWMASH